MHVPICLVIAQKNVSVIYVKKSADRESLFLKVACKKLNLVMAKIDKSYSTAQPEDLQVSSLKFDLFF